MKEGLDIISRILRFRGRFLVQAKNVPESITLKESNYGQLGKYFFAMSFLDPNRPMRGTMILGMRIKVKSK